MESGCPPAETVWVDPYPDEGLGLEDGPAGPEARYELRESVELAFVAALQHLPANQRAALILREVLGFSAREVAESLDTTVASVNSALQRARKTIDDDAPEQSQQATLRALGDERLRELVEGYMDAMQRGDVEAVVSLLAEDAAWSMPPLRGLVQRPRGPPRLHALRAAVRRLALAPCAHARERPAGGGQLRLVRAGPVLPPVRARRDDLRRRPDLGRSRRSSTAPRSAATSSSTSAGPSSRWTPQGRPTSSASACPTA